MKQPDDNMAWKWESLGTTGQTKSFHWPFDCLHPRTLAKLKNLGETKICESLEISKLEVKAKFDETIKVLNRNRGNIANKIFWKPLFRKINLVT